MVAITCQWHSQVLDFLATWKMNAQYTCNKTWVLKWHCKCQHVYHKIVFLVVAVAC